MLVPKESHEVPTPDGWVYRCKDTGFVFCRSSYGELEKTIKIHKENNHLGYDHKEVLLNIKDNTGSKWFEEVEDPEKRKVTVRDLMGFILNISSWVYHGAKLCGEGEARSRLDTCLACPQRQLGQTGEEDSTCSSCPKPTAIMLKAMGERDLTKEPAVYCRVCKCLMNVRVYFKEIQERESDYPAECWKRRR